MLTSNSKKIEPCPFCGEKAIVKARRLQNPRYRGAIEVFVECRNCHSRGPSFNDVLHDDSKSSLSTMAIDAWNTRKKHMPL